jgi:hypothetical protein
MVKPTKTVLFADVLGFSGLASAPRAEGATDALSDLAHLLSSSDELVTLLGSASSPWTERYGLSDSIFLVSEEPIRACKAAAEFFFNLAYVNHQARNPVLLRGAISIGEALQVQGIFPESSKANLVGEAVVRAVKLEEEGPKGPKLLLTQEAARAWEESSETPSWLLSRNERGQAELLWLLPPDPSMANGLQIGEVCRTAFRLAREHGTKTFGYHYIGYLDLVARSLQRLRSARPEEAVTAIQVSALTDEVSSLEPLLLTPEAILLDRFRSLAR